MLAHCYHDDFNQGHGNHVGRSRVGRLARTGCIDMLVHPHVLHVLCCGFDVREHSGVIVRKCKISVSISLSK